MIDLAAKNILFLFKKNCEGSFQLTLKKCVENLFVIIRSNNE